MTATVHPTAIVDPGAKHTSLRLVATLDQQGARFDLENGDGRQEQVGRLDGSRRIESLD